MKTSLTHLPEIQQKEIVEILQIIKKKQILRKLFCLVVMQEAIGLRMNMKRTVSNLALKLLYQISANLILLMCSEEVMSIPGIKWIMLLRKKN